MMGTVAERRASRRIYQFLTTGAAKRNILGLWEPAQFDSQSGAPPASRRPMGLRRLA